MTVHTQTPARAARRQLLVDRFTEYLAERCGDQDRALAYAKDLLGLVDDAGFALPAPARGRPRRTARERHHGRARLRRVHRRQGSPRRTQGLPPVRRVSGLPRPLPECARCRAPLPRAVWRTRHVCSDCATPAELMTAAHARHDLSRVTEATNRRVNSRIDELAAKRAARAARGL